MTDKTKTTNLENWCRGKPFLLGELAKNLIPRLRETHESMAKIRRGKADEPTIVVPLNMWHRLYRRDKHIFRAIVTLMSGTADVKAVHTVLRESSYSELMESIQEVVVRTGGLDRTWAQAIQSIVEAEGENRDTLLFILLCFGEYWNRVLLPCWLHYGVMPAMLLRRARQGDLQAVDDLLRLDKSMVSDRLIAQVWHRIMTGNQPLKRKQMLDALASEPRRSLSAKKLKMWTGGVLMLVADMTGYDLKMGELREVFDVVVKDQNGYLIDTDLPDGDEAFYHAIRREKQGLLEALGLTANGWQAKVFSLMAS